MSNKIYLLLLAVLALAACEPSKQLSPDEQRQLERQDRQLWRQLGGD